MRDKLSFILLSLVLLCFSSAYADFTQKSDFLGLVTMPAEDYDSLRDGSKGDTFADSTTFAGFLGSSYMQGTDAGVYNPNTTAETDAPALSYNINFTKTGAHYIWVRKYFIDGQNDSFYYGLGDSIASQNDMIPHGSYGVWEWVKGPTSFNIPTAGAHTLTIYLRERGAAIDHIIVTTSDTFNPSTDWNPKEIVLVSDPAKMNPDIQEHADQYLIDGLEAQGYAVSTVFSADLSQASQGLIDTLNAADLVIVARSPLSGNFDASKKPTWNAITSPLVLMTPWAARSNRLNWLQSTSITTYDVAGETVSAKIETPDDAVFAGATLAADSTMDWCSTPYDYIVTTDGGNGTVLARSASNSNVFFVRWDPWTEFYDGAGDYAAGYRTLIGNGNDHFYETAAGPFNYDNFSDDAQQVFFNEVARMAELGKVEKPVGLDKEIVLFSDPAKMNPDIQEHADQYLIDGLEAQGYAVSTVFSADLSQASQGLIDTLNAADLVIVARSPLSGNFDASKKPTWNAITSPLVLMTPWAARSNRLNWLQSTSITTYDVAGETVSAKIETPDDAVFAGATLAADSTMDWCSTPYDYIVTTDGGNGTVLARSASNSNVFFVRWDPWTEFYDGAGDYAAGYRTLIGNGNDHFYETAAGPFNYDNFSDDAQQVFFNEVARMAELGKVEEPTSVAEANSTIPTVYALEQNYPNPFNPETIIKYSLPKAGKTTLKIYNALGQVVTTLVDQEKAAGVYTVSFKAASFSSGIYFYRIESGDFVKVKKMMLLK